MRHEIARPERGREDASAPHPHAMFNQNMKDIVKALTPRVCIFNNSAGPLEAPAPQARIRHSILQNYVHVYTR